MSIYVVTGKPRHGKTFFIVRQIPRWLKNGERIFSNVKLNLGTGALKKFDDSLIGNINSESDLNNKNKQIFYWKNIHEWNKMNNGIILVDEAQRYFNARSWNQLSEETEIKLQQHGKEDLDVWATTQHFTRIDITLRILVEIFYKVEMTIGSPNNFKSWFPKRINIQGWLLEDLERIERLGKKQLENDEMEPESSESYWIRKKYYEIYDTRAQVGKSEPMPLIHQIRYCSNPNCEYHIKGKVEHK